MNSIRSAISSAPDNSDEVKVLIDGPSQIQEVRKFLEAQDFANVQLVDDEGIVYLTASRKIPDDKPSDTLSSEVVQPTKISQDITLKISTGVIISCDTRKYNTLFLASFLRSLAQSKIKPDILALTNSAVKLAAYNSPTVDYIHELVASGVEVLISESCADRLGISDALGVGVTVAMSAIIEKIFACERIMSI